MKRIACMLLCLALFLGAFTGTALAANSDAFRVDAKAALLIDLNTGDVLYEQDADAQIYPASLTKIMTAILAIEQGNLDDVITATSTALTNLDPDGTSVWLTAGEQMPLRDLLYCMLLSSANDACNVVAEYIAGSVADFVVLMNEKAEELGCTGTHFNNTNGLPDENHWTTARDLAIITQYAIQNETFWQMCTTTSYNVPATNVFDVRNIVTTNSMATTFKYYTFYDSRVQGVKTGYTASAGRCLIVTAQEDDSRILSVVCGAPDTMMYNNVSWYGHYADTEMLLNYGFGILDGSIIPQEAAPQAPQEVTDPAAEAPATDPVAPTEPAQTPVLDAPTDVPAPTQPELSPADSTQPAAPAADARSTFPWGLLIIIVLAVLVEACIVYVLVYRHQYKARRLRRQSAKTLPDTSRDSIPDSGEEQGEDL